MTTPPGSLLQHHFRTLQSTMGSVRRSSWANSLPLMGAPRATELLKKVRIKVRALEASELGRKGKSRKGVSRAVNGP